MVTRSINELTQFEEGLDVLGFKNLVKSYPLQFKELFIHNPKVVTGHDLDELFLPLLSSEGSNLREKEEALVLNWKEYIYDQGKFNFNDIGMIMAFF